MYCHGHIMPYCGYIRILNSPCQTIPSITADNIALYRADMLVMLGLSFFVCVCVCVEGENRNQRQWDSHSAADLFQG